MSNTNNNDDEMAMYERLGKIGEGTYGTVWNIFLYQISLINNIDKIYGSVSEKLTLGILLFYPIVLFF
jgi:hypothetical protein